MLEIKSSISTKRTNLRFVFHRYCTNTIGVTSGFGPGFENMPTCYVQVHSIAAFEVGPVLLCDDPAGTLPFSEHSSLAWSLRSWVLGGENDSSGNGKSRRYNSRGGHIMSVSIERCISHKELKVTPCSSGKILLCPRFLLFFIVPPSSVN